MALHGTTALIGAPDRKVGSNTGQGSAYFFKLTSGVRTSTMVVNGSISAATTHFGDSVAITASRAIVGAPRSFASIVGDAYVFVKATGAWNPTSTARLQGTTATNKGFGWSVAISTTLALAGAPDSKVTGTTQEGDAILFTLTGGTWTTTSGHTRNRKIITAAGAFTIGNFFGWSVALTGANAAIGAADQTVGGVADQGAVFTFKHTGSSWLYQHEYVRPDHSAASEFGLSTVLTGTSLLAGAPNGVGRGYSISISTTSYSVLVPPNTAGSGMFGYSLSLSSTTALVGADTSTVSGNAGEGVAFIETGTPTKVVPVGLPRQPQFWVREPHSTV